MISGIFDSTTIPALQEAMQFAQARHEVLAGNIANLDTPGYRVRDLSPEVFQERLKEAIEARETRNEPWSPGSTSTPGDPLNRVSESMRSILYHDDSNVGIEQQVTEMTKNQFLHNVAISVMSSQFRLLQTAISERV